MTTDIRDKIKEQLKWDTRIDASQIEVDVKDKKVELTGKVPSLVGKTTATVSTISVASGYQVDNQLEVAYPEGFEVPSDAELRNSVRVTLRSYPLIDETDIDVLVDKGNVTLKGTVDAFWKKQRAEQMTGTISGILDIKNNIAVVPSERVVDEEIGKQVVNALERDSRVDVSQVDVSVSDGVVTLRGDVPDWAGYAAALYCASNTVAVKNVMSDLKVQGGVVDTLRTIFSM